MLNHIYIVLGGSIFNLLAFSLNNTIRGDGNPKLAATIMVVGCLTNIVLDAVLIFVFNMGVQVSIIISLAISAIGILFGDTILKSFGASESTLYYAKSYIYSFRWIYI